MLITPFALPPILYHFFTTFACPAFSDEPASNKIYTPKNGKKREVAGFCSL